MASLSCCANYDIKQNHPLFLDTQKGYARKYQAQSVQPKQCGDPNYEFIYSGQTVPIDKMNGYVCFETSEVQANLRYYNEFLRKRASCPQDIIGE